MYRDEKTSRYHSISRQLSALPSIFYNGNTRRQLLRLYIMTFPCRCSKVSSAVISCCLSPTGSSLKLSPAYYSLSLQIFFTFLQYHRKRGLVNPLFLSKLLMLDCCSRSYVTKSLRCNGFVAGPISAGSFMFFLIIHYFERPASSVRLVKTIHLRNLP